MYICFTAANLAMYSIKNTHFALIFILLICHKFFLSFNHQHFPLSCQELDRTRVFGVVEGGDILEERVRSARETAKRPVAGFCLDGFQTGAMDQDLRTQLITAVTKELPEDKPRSACS